MVIHVVIEDASGKDEACGSDRLEGEGDEL